MMKIKIENVEIIRHFKDGYGNIHGIYKCNMLGDEKVFIRHGDEVGVICFWLGEPVEKCISKARGDVAKEVIALVEIELNNQRAYEEYMKLVKERANDGKID